MQGDSVQGVVGASALRTDAPIVLSVQNVSKTYPGTRALDGVSLDIRRGEIHALCGGNGSGKSTLVKILSGVVQGDGGTIQIGEHELDASHIRARQSRELGVRVVHQDLALFPDMSVGENMMLGAEYPTTAVQNVRWSELRDQARLQIDRFEIAAKPSTLVRDLPIGIRAQVAIARALQDVKTGEGLLILDEPTASLPAHEVDLLLRAVRRLAAAGQAVLFVSHRLDEVLSLTDRVTVFRDGRVFAEHRTAELTEGELIEAIIGAQADSLEQARSGTAVKSGRQPLLSVSDLHAGPLRGVDLEVMPGEVVGVAGLLGSGRSELLRTIYGDLKRTAGTVTVAGEPANFSRMDQAIARGIVMIPEDRAGGAAFAGLTVDENLDCSVLRRYWTIRGFRRSQLRRDAAALRARFRVRASGGGALMSSLSGGNQQKTVFARWLRREPVLLLLDEPTQGVDVGARGDIHAAMRQVTEAGGAAVLVLSDLEELAQVADRAVVLRQGVITAHVRGEELTAHRLNELIYQESEQKHG